MTVWNASRTVFVSISARYRSATGPGRSQRSQLITIVSTTTPTGRALVMPQPTPPGTLSSPLLGRHRRRGAREVAANERGEEPRRGDRPSARAHLAARQPTQPECRAASRRTSLNAGGVFILTRARLPLPPGPAAGRDRRVARAEAVPQLPDRLPVGAQRLDELAWPAADWLRSRRQPDRRHHHPHRPHRPRRT